MEKKRKSKIRKWDEVAGATEIEVDEITADATEEADDTEADTETETTEEAK